MDLSGLLNPLPSVEEFAIPLDKRIKTEKINPIQEILNQVNKPISARCSSPSSFLLATPSTKTQVPKQPRGSPIISAPPVRNQCVASPSPRVPLELPSSSINISGIDWLLIPNSLPSAVLSDKHRDQVGNSMMTNSTNTSATQHPTTQRPQQQLQLELQDPKSQIAFNACVQQMNDQVKQSRKKKHQVSSSSPSNTRAVVCPLAIRIPLPPSLAFASSSSSSQFTSSCRQPAIATKCRRTTTDDMTYSTSNCDNESSSSSCEYQPAKSSSQAHNKKIQTMATMTVTKSKQQRGNKRVREPEDLDHVDEDDDEPASFPTSPTTPSENVDCFVPAPVRRFECGFRGCHKAFAQPNHLKSHLRLHTGDKLFRCDLPGCDKAFTQIGHLISHKRVHTGERPFACDFPGCDRAFSQSTNLVVHKRTHDSRLAKPHQCQIEGCGKMYSARSRLRLHISKVHNIDPLTLNLKSWKRTDKELLHLHLHATSQSQCE
eukprot:c10259_g1_i2.p1 GENE.c10259_g1_i2~~c10259_g1_i2.p1  ORF type:complete len:501 (+),score=88.02 c10259_g1_i2:42-1505(+)